MSMNIKPADSWHWKQLLKVRNALREGLQDPAWSAIRQGAYNVSAAYEWLLGSVERFIYAPVIWHSLVDPKHGFML